MIVAGVSNTFDIFFKELCLKLKKTQRSLSEEGDSSSIKGTGDAGKEKGLTEGFKVVAPLEVLTKGNKKVRLRDLRWQHQRT